MKDRRKGRKKLQKRNEHIDSPILDVSLRKRLVEEKQDLEELEKNIEELRKELEDITLQIEVKYYSKNTAVDNILRRNFIDLVKILLERLKKRNRDFFTKKKVKDLA